MGLYVFTPPNTRSFLELDLGLSFTLLIIKYTTFTRHLSKPIYKQGEQ